VRAELGGEVEESGELLPGPLPEPDNRRVALAAALGEFQPPGLGRIRRQGGAGRPELLGDRGPVGFRRVVEAAAHEMHYARLNLAWGQVASIAPLAGHVDHRRPRSSHRLPRGW
jgi:hypothetical protein